MTIFQTEFPVTATVDKSAFIAQVATWVKGMTNTSLFRNDNSLTEFDNEAILQSSTGEQLSIREVMTEGLFSIGAQHRIYDSEGRLWQSEVTLTVRNGLSAILCKVQCIRNIDNAYIRTPRKPYFVTLAMDDEWGGEDGILRISKKYHLLRDEQFEAMRSLLEGGATYHLPILYISYTAEQSNPKYRNFIKKLAVRLAGMAHIVVEPDRNWSEKLRNSVGKFAPYNGAMCIYLSKKGFSKKFYFGSVIQDYEHMADEVYQYVSNYSAYRRPTLSLEWQELSEKLTASIREKLSIGNSSIDTLNQMIEEEIAAKDTKIVELQRKVDALEGERLQHTRSDHDFSFLSTSYELGNELYPGEFGDRLISFITEHLKNTSNLSIRTIEIMKIISQQAAISNGGKRLKERLKVAGKDSGKADDRIAEILRSVGYSKRAQNGHPVFEPDGLIGLQNVILSSSPSDTRSGKNLSLTVARILGLSDLE